VRKETNKQQQQHTTESPVSSCPIELCMNTPLDSEYLSEGVVVAKWYISHYYDLFYLPDADNFSHNYGV